MKPASFRYFAPATVADAVSILSEHRDEAKILAGGQSLVPALNFRLGRYDVLVDINRITQLSFIRVEAGVVRIGATTRQRDIETSALVARHLPLVAEATTFIAHLPIRSRGTIGGSLAHADPAAEYPAVALALDAEFVVEGASGPRTIAAREFFVGPLQTAIQSGEMLTEIRFAARTAGQGFAIDEISRRKGDFALLGVAAAIERNERRIERARIALFGLADGQVRAEAAERVLTGQVPTPELFEAAGQAAADSLATQDDLHATAAYRTHLIRSLVSRVASMAFDRATEALS